MTLQTIGSIALLIIVGGILLWGLFGPSQLYADAIEKTEPWVDDLYRRMYKEKEEEIKEKVSEDIEEMFYNLIDDFEKETGTAPCLLTHTTFVEKFKEYRIVFDNNEGYAYLYKENAFRDQQKINKKVCVIDSKNFYDNYIKRKPCSPNCGQNYREVDTIEIRDKDKIYFNGKEYGLKDLNLMFKADDEHVCFFPTKGGGLLQTCDADGGILGENCLRDLMPKIISCEGDAIPMFFNNQFYGLRKDWENINGRWKYNEADARVPYYFSHTSITPYTFQAILRHTFETPPEGKNGVFYSRDINEHGDYYGKKEHWNYFNEKKWLVLGTEGWKYTGTEEVPEKFKTKGISNMDKYNVFGPPKTQ